MFCLQRVQRVGTTLNDVVRFSLTHGQTKLNLSVSEVVEKFVEVKRRVGRSSNYTGSAGECQSGCSLLSSQTH